MKKESISRPCHGSSKSNLISKELVQMRLTRSGAVVDGDRMRMITADEAMAAQSFPKDTLRPDHHRLTMHMTGNAVPPLAGQRIIEALMKAC